MPKINRKHYARAKRIADASINIVESIHNDISSLVQERDELVNTTNVNKNLSKDLSLTCVAIHNDKYELINNEEEPLIIKRFLVKIMIIATLIIAQLITIF